VAALASVQARGQTASVLPIPDLGDKVGVKYVQQRGPLISGGNGGILMRSSGPVARRVVAVPLGVAVAAVVLAGCGHSTTHAAGNATFAVAPSTSAAAATSFPTSASPSPSSSSAAAYKPLTRKQLAALLPPRSALPGFKATPADNSADDKASQQQDAEVAACVGTVDTDPLQVAQASSPTFTLTSSSEVQAITATAVSFKTTSAVTSDVKSLKNPRYLPCFKKELSAHGASLFGHGLTYVSSKVTITPGKTSTVAGEIDAVLQLKTAAGKPVVLGVTEVLLVRRGVEEALTFIAQGKAVTATVARSFVTQAATDLARGTATVSA